MSASKLTKPLYIHSGDRSILIKFGDRIHPVINKQIRTMLYLIDKEKIRGIENLIPGYTTLLVTFNPLILHAQKLLRLLRKLQSSVRSIRALPSFKRVEIPVCYGGEFGPDLADVAAYNNLSSEEVIEIHSSQEYLVYFTGFVPGFPYLGGMSKRIAMPRLASPRPRVPAGSVAIAEQQTGIYPVETPGGWRIIGRTPLRLFSPHSRPPTLLQAGDEVRFVPITGKQFEEIQEEVKSGRYNGITPTIEYSET